MNSKKIEHLKDRPEIDMICLDDVDSDNPEEERVKSSSAVQEIIGIDDLEEDVDRNSKQKLTKDQEQEDLDLQEIISLSA